MEDNESTRLRRPRAWVVPAVAVVAAFTLTGAGRATAAAIADMIVGVQDLPGDAEGTKVAFQSHDNMVVDPDLPANVIVLEGPSAGELTVELLTFRAIAPTGEVPVVTVRTHGVATRGLYGQTSNNGGPIYVALEAVADVIGPGGLPQTIWMGNLAGRFHSRNQITISARSLGSGSFQYALEASAAGYLATRRTRTE